MTKLISPTRFLSLLALLALLLPAPAPAQNQPPGRALQASDLIRVTPRRVPNGKAPPTELKTRVEAFLNKLKLSETKNAYAELLSGSRISQQPEQVQLLIAKTDQAFGVYGKLIKFEPYDTYSVGSSVVSTTYLTNLPVQPLRWRFIFYKAEDEWTVIDVRVDDVLIDMLEN